MKRILLASLVLMLLNQSSFCQVSDIFRVTKKTDIGNKCIHPDSVKEIIFDESAIKELDIKWNKFINVKQITFTNHAKIPSNLHIFPNVDKLSFTNYDSIHFPSDFPYLKFIDLSLVGIMKTPSEIQKFKNLEIIFSNETGGHCIIDYLLSLKKIKSVIISAIQDTINTDFCSLEQLEKLHLHDVKFGLHSLDLSCLKHLSLLYISESNLVNLILRKSSLSYLQLENNRIPKQRVQELKDNVLKMDNVPNELVE